MRHSATLGGACAPAGKRVGLTRHVLSHFFAVALCLGTLAGSLDAIGLTTGRPAGAVAASVVKDTLHCWAETDKLTEGATETVTYVATSTPATITPGGGFTDTFAPNGSGQIPSKTGTYKITWVGNETTRLALPATATVVSGPTIKSPGYYWKPTAPATHMAITTTATLATDSNAPGGKIVKIASPTEIPGGDDYIDATISVQLVSSADPRTNKFVVGLLTVQPVGSSHTSTDPAFGAQSEVTAGSVGGHIVATLNCWPYPAPQPPFVTTQVNDDVAPTITITTPGATSKVVVNSSVHANFVCTDTPTYGDGIKSCTATNTGHSTTDGSPITTSVLGTHTFTVRAVNNSTVASATTSKYTVIKPPYNLVPPTISLTSPLNGGQYVTGSTVKAKFSCKANTGTTITYCTGTDSSGTAITTSAGYHTFTVQTRDRQGNPTTETVGYFDRTGTKSNQTATSSSDMKVTSTWSSSNWNCSLGEDYSKIGITALSEDETFTKEACVFGATHFPVVDYKVTGPTHGGQVAVGDKLHVIEQIYRPGAHAANSATATGYDTGPYKETVNIAVPSGTVITGEVTTSKTGLPTSAYGTASAQLASACNYNQTGTIGTGSGKFCSAVTGGSSYTAWTTHSGGAVAVTSLTGSSDLAVASTTTDPFTSTGGNLQATTTTGVAALTYTGISGNTFTGVKYVSGAKGQIDKGASVAEPTVTAIHGAVKVDGQAVTGWTWAVTATGKTSLPVQWNGSSCQNNTGTPHPAGTKTKSRTYTSCLTPGSPEKYGIDGAYIYVAFTARVVSAGSVTVPGIGAIGSSVKTNNTSITGFGTLLSSQYSSGSTLFSTLPTSAPGISFTAVDPAGPTAMLSTPSQGAVYSYGKTVKAQYNCSDPTSGVTIKSCKGVETWTNARAHTVATGGALTTSTTATEIHTFAVTAVNSETYTSISYATFITLANPPTLATQTFTVTSGGSVTVPFNYTGTYPAAFSSEKIASSPSHGTATIQSTGRITYHNNNSAFATDSFEFSVSDTAGNPSNLEVVNLHIENQNKPTITAVTPSANDTGSYTRKAVEDATFSCGDTVEVISCTATQTVTGFPTEVTDGRPFDTTSLIVGNTHHLKITAVGFGGALGNQTTTETLSYTVNTPHPVASNITVKVPSTGSTTIHVLTHVTSTFPIAPATLTVVTFPLKGTATVERSHVIQYTPRTGSSGVTHDSFTYEVKDSDGQVSNTATVGITIFPAPTITSLSRTSGPASGGNTVTITGTALSTAQHVRFGTTTAEAFTVRSSTQILATAPAHAAGQVRISVTTAGGTTPATNSDLYTYP